MEGGGKKEIEIEEERMVNALRPPPPNQPHHTGQEGGSDDKGWYLNRINDIYPRNVVLEIISSAPATPNGVRSNAIAEPLDGVFANIPAKPESQFKENELPPVRFPLYLRMGAYGDVWEQPYADVAQDAVPPYFDATVLSDDPEEILVEGLPVGSSFSFIWNMMSNNCLIGANYPNGVVSMTFQFIGFLLTYLLHTSHAAKNGSRAGLGITLIQYGLYIRSAGNEDVEASSGWTMNSASDGDGTSGKETQVAHAAIVSFFLMIIGWFLVIRSTGEYIRVRRILSVITTQPDGAV